jgi:hypothetical protein
MLKDFFTAHPGLCRRDVRRASRLGVIFCRLAIHRGLRLRGARRAAFSFREDRKSDHPAVAYADGDASPPPAAWPAQPTPGRERVGPSPQLKRLPSPQGGTILRPVDRALSAPRSGRGGVDAEALLTRPAGRGRKAARQRGASRAAAAPTERKWLPIQVCQDLRRTE